MNIYIEVNAQFTSYCKLKKKFAQTIWAYCILPQDSIYQVSLLTMWSGIIDGTEYLIYELKVLK